MIKPALKINADFRAELLVCALNLIIERQYAGVSAAIEYFPTAASGPPPSPLT